jgi:hypothetical protein
MAMPTRLQSVYARKTQRPMVRGQIDIFDDEFTVIQVRSRVPKLDPRGYPAVGQTAGVPAGFQVPVLNTLVAVDSTP